VETVGRLRLCGPPGVGRRHRRGDSVVRIEEEKKEGKGKWRHDNMWRIRIRGRTSGYPWTPLFFFTKFPLYYYNLLSYNIK
jgi:hypothetical protein